MAVVVCTPRLLPSQAGFRELEEVSQQCTSRLYTAENREEGAACILARQSVEKHGYAGGLAVGGEQ